MVYDIENPMVIGNKFDIPDEVKEKLNGPGHKEMGTGIFVPEEDAFDYAIEHCALVPFMVVGIEWTQEFKDMLVEWFYSGNWIKEE